MPREISNYRKFFEANIRDNEGLDRDYIDNIRDRETSDANRKIRTGEVAPPHSIMGIVSELMRIQGGELRFGPMGPMPIWRDHARKAEIEELARNIINDRYGRILDALNIEMDIALVDQQELSDMKQGEEMSDNPEPLPEYEETDDQDLKADVDKRKIANIITQGSAKNVHRLIHLYQDMISDLDPRLFSTMDRLIKSNEVAEWTMPERPGMGRMVRQMMNGFSKVEFDNQEGEDEFKEMAGDVDQQDIQDAMDSGEFNTEDSFEAWDGKIKVKARGLDLVILLHESVKGIFEALAAPSIPEFDVQRATDILANTDTLDDEFEDLRYGPAIRADLLTWVNTNNKVNQIEDGFEYVWGAMISIPSRPFLELFFDAIIGKTGKADKWLDDTLDRLVQEEKEFKQAQFEYEQEVERWEQQQKLSGDTDSYSDADISDQEPDYSKMSKRELGKERDIALDNGDFETLKKISQYL